MHVMYGRGKGMQAVLGDWMEMGSGRWVEMGSGRWIEMESGRRERAVRMAHGEEGRWWWVG